MINTFLKTYVNIVTEFPTLNIAWNEHNNLMAEAEKEFSISDEYRTQWHNFNAKSIGDKVENSRLQHEGYAHDKAANYLVDKATDMWNDAVRSECGDIVQTWEYNYDTKRKIKWKVYTLKKRGVRLKFNGIDEHDWFIDYARNARL